jgi:hypothetical protein
MDIIYIIVIISQIMVVVSIAIFDDQRLDGTTASVQFGQVKWLWSSGSWMWQRWLPETLTAGQSSPWGTCQHQTEQRSDGHWTLPPLWNRDAMHNARSNQSIGIPSRIESLEILETGNQSISLDMAHPRLLASIYIYMLPPPEIHFWSGLQWVSTWRFESRWIGEQ